MSRPAVSVVIPTYNSGRFVTHAIESVLAQSFEDIEIIVVDDGSTDGTEARVAVYGPQISYVERPHRGPGAARNHGAALARGEWLAFLDADDFWYPRRLELQLTMADAHKNLEFVTGNHHNVDENGRLMGKAFDDNPMVGGEPDRPAYDGLVFGPADGARYVEHRFGILSTTLVRTDLFLSVGGFDERLRLAEDVHLMYRLVAAARSFGAVRVPIAAYRVRRGSTSHREAEQRHRTTVRAFRNLLRTACLPRPMARAVRKVLAEIESDLAVLLARQKRRLPATLAACRAFMFRPGRNGLRHMISVNMPVKDEPKPAFDDSFDPVEQFLFGAIT